MLPLRVQLGYTHYFEEVFMFRNNEAFVGIMDGKAVSEKEWHIQLIGYDAFHGIGYWGLGGNNG